MEDMREKNGRSIKSVIASLTWLNPEGQKICPLCNAKQFDAKQFDQTFLKFDAWGEYTRERSTKTRKARLEKVRR